MALDIKDISVHNARHLHLYDSSHEDTHWFHFGVECEDIGYCRDGITLFYDEKFHPQEVERAMIEYLEKKGYTVREPGYQPHHEE